MARDAIDNARSGRIQKKQDLDLLSFPAQLLGDFEGDQPFTSAAWIKWPANDSSAAILARMDDGNDYRGWDLWVEGRRVGAHIINKWQDNALKVVTAAPAETLSDTRGSYGSP